MLPESLFGLTLLRPFALLLLIPSLLLCWLLYRRVNRHSVWDRLLPAAARKALLQRDPGGRHSGRFILLGSAWLLAIVALAGPAWESDEPAPYLDQSALIVVLDLSRNMLANDLQPNRLERARMKVRDLMQLRSDSQLALIVYAGTAHRVTPLSNDQATLDNLLAALEPDIMPEHGQNLQAGMRLATEMAASLPRDSTRVLLITSGVAPQQLQELDRIHAQLGSQLSVLGVGTREGSPVPLPEGGFMRDNQGQILLPRLDSSTLAGIARRHGGRYQQITADDSDLQALVPATAPQSAAGEASTRISDQGHWLVLLLLPLAALGARRGWLAVLLCGLLLPATSEAQLWQNLWQRPDQQAMELLRDEQPDAAAQRFEDPQWRAWALYQSGDYAAASEAFEQLLRADPDNAEHHFNHGTALAMNQRYEQALEAYEQTLTRAPEHQAARHNRSRVEALLEALKAQQQAEQEQQQGSDEQAEPGGADESASPGNPPEQQRPTPADEAATADSADDEGPSAQGQTPQTAGGAEVDGQNASSQTSDMVGPGDSASEPSNNEQQAALQQWLQDVPDHPSELLRRKFLYQRLQQLENISQ